MWMPAPMIVILVVSVAVIWWFMERGGNGTRRK
jgi:hypothetical protein